MRNNLLLRNAALTMLVLRATPPGSVQAQRMADTTPYPLPAGSHRLPDWGWQAFPREGVDRSQPTQKPRGKAWTPEQKVGHREVARRRGRIAQVHRRVKRWRMLTETIRMWQDGMRDMVMAIGCALQNFRVRVTPSWTPMI